MAGLSTDEKNGILDHITGRATYTADDFWIQLHTGDPGSAGTLNVASTSSRRQVTFTGNAASGAIAVGDAGSPAARWDAVDASETVTHASVWDASTLGNFKGAGPLSASKNLINGDPFEIRTFTLRLLDS